MIPTPYIPPPSFAAAGGIGSPTTFFPFANCPSTRTRLQRWTIPSISSAQSAAINLSIKRDDETDTLAAGNKIRKLSFLLADAVAKGCDTVVTIGGKQSNHARATALLAQRLSLSCVVILRVKDDEIAEAQSTSLAHALGLEGNVLLDRMANAQIIVVPLSVYRRLGATAILADVHSQLSRQNKKPYIIPMGGSNALGAWGYVEGFREIAEQYKIAAAEHGEGLATAPSDIVVASGSGGTVAGLCLGSFLSGPNSHTGHYTIIHSIAVCDNAEYFRSHVRDVFQQLNLPVEAVDQVLNSVDKYRGVAYAVSTDAELDIIASVARATGIVTDPVYSGKALVGLIDMMNGGGAGETCFKGKDVVFLHTGGVFGWFTEDKLKQLVKVLPDRDVSMFVEGK